MTVIDLVKWNASDNLYVWKYPSEELSTWTQLIVSESQEAVVLLGGEMCGPFGPGRHTLDTQNLPLLVSLLKIPRNFGGTCGGRTHDKRIKSPLLYQLS